MLDSIWSTLRSVDTEPILKTPDFNKHFEIAVDACNIGNGAVLLQRDEKVGWILCVIFAEKYILLLKKKLEHLSKA